MSAAIRFVDHELVQATRALFGTGANNATLTSLSAPQLKSRFRKMALCTHPDRAGALGLEAAKLNARFQKVNWAYNLLSAYLEHSSSVPRAANQAQPPKQATARPQASNQAQPPKQATARPQASNQAQPPKRATARPQTANERVRSSRGRRDETGSGHARGAGPPRRGCEDSSNPPTSSDSRRDTRKNGGVFWRGAMPAHRIRFGQYLFYRGIASWKDVIDAVIWQRGERPLFGQIAVDWGFFSRADLFTLLRNKQLNERLGDAAVRLGLLTPYQRAVVAGTQLRTHRQLGQFFVDHGILTSERLDELVAEHRKHSSRYHQHFG